MNQGFSRSQQGHYRPVVKAAWLAHCAKTGLAPNTRGARDPWYRDELMACIAENTTARCNQVMDFDIVIRHFARIAGDEYWINRIADAPERRLRKLIGDRLQELGDLDGGHYTWAYARGIYAHMRPGIAAPESMEDAPAGILRKVFIALDAQVRRVRFRLKKQQPEGIPF